MTAPPPHFGEHEFRKATRSEPKQDCVHVARRANWVVLRDSKAVFESSDDHRLVFTGEEFDAFLAGAREGRTEGHALRVERRVDGSYAFRNSAPGLSAELVFTESEVLAFYEGVVRGEFDAHAFA